ncbi:hypothetical protein [Streptomyces sporangiiformans]|uniref:Thioesterase domain-containing protein n=1 Tax=Streptomyces sporangiiformans TaxID=2315329 RepID=A0A505DQL0_9ACTN|nr:hypothetical protein [Streptomyces sporangiiformans]TPQ23480.1 hypothetical protein FGD71_004495 [Streptomyces sporangiiformans]
MGGPEFWEESRSGTTGELILAVDIPSGENAMGLRELVPLLNTAHTVWRAVEQAHVPLEGGSLAAYVEPWADAVRSSGFRVRAVLGHRVGSVLAGAIAEALGGPGQPPPSVLLFDPELVDTDMVVSEFRRMLADDPHLLSAEEVTRLDRDLDSVAERCLDDPAALAVRLQSVFIRAADRSGTRARATTERLNRAVDRLSVLALAEAYDVIPVWSRCTALCSSSPGKGLSRTRAALLLPEAGFVAREVSFRDKHTEMLSSPVVAQTVSELLTVSEQR